MYEDYFGLDRPPFKITPDTSLFFEGGKRGDILAALGYSIHRGEGIVKVVGEVGSGKTMLCRMLQLRLPESVEIVYIANPSVSPEDILFVIAHELSLEVTRDASKHEVMHLLQDYLLQRHMDDRQVVLFIEEAQGMPIETLEEIRLLSNLETDQNKLLQIVLFGQPELDHNLSQQSIRQLRERITHSFNLEPLSQHEIHSYLNFRMREVGYTGPELITAALAKKVELHSAGLLRRINIIADKILLSAFAEGTHDLGAKHVNAAVEDSSFGEVQQSAWKLIWLPGLLALAALVYALFATRFLWLPGQGDMAANAGETKVVEKPLVEISGSRTDKGGIADGAAGRPAAEVAGAPVQSAAGTDNPGAPESPGLSVPVAILQAETKVDTVSVETGERESPVSSRAVDTAPEPGEGFLKASLQSNPVAPADNAVSKTAIEDSTLQKALDQAASNLANREAPPAATDLTGDYREWLNAKLQQSRDWLSNADRNKVSIQVLMRSKSAARELVYYLRNEWPLDLSKTYLYEMSTETRSIYRVFYSEFDSLSIGRNEIERLPDSVKANSPYLNSVHRMQKALL